jgi:hypothetical protein
MLWCDRGDPARPTRSLSNDPHRDGVDVLLRCQPLEQHRETGIIDYGKPGIGEDKPLGRKLFLAANRLGG